MTDINFAAIGINHSHIYGQVDCLMRAGAQFVAFHADEDDLAARVRREISAGQARRRPARDPRGSRRSHMVAHLRHPGRARRDCHRGDAARQGRDERQAGHDHLRPARRDQARAGGDRPHLSRSAIPSISRPAPRSRPANWSSPGRHRQGGQHGRPRARTRSATTSGPTGSSTASAMAASSATSPATSSSSSCSSPARLDAEVVSASVANRGNPEQAGAAGCRRRASAARPTPRAISASTGSRPTGLPTWGDGRLTILGTEGYIELRKYIDIAGRPGHGPPVPRRQARARATSIAPTSICPTAGS